MTGGSSSAVALLQLPAPQDGSRTPQECSHRVATTGAGAYNPAALACSGCRTAASDTGMLVFSQSTPVCQTSVKLKTSNWGDWLPFCTRSASQRCKSSQARAPGPACGGTAGSMPALLPTRQSSGQADRRERGTHAAWRPWPRRRWAGFWPLGPRRSAPPRWSAGGQEEIGKGNKIKVSRGVMPAGQRCAAAA